jgi:HTH-type transcriptional regulator/antitoxin HigA
MIKSEKDYKAILERIEELLAIPENIEDPDAKSYLELNRLADLVADYEKNTWIRDELIEGEESGQSTRTMAEVLEVARKRKTE